MIRCTKDSKVWVINVIVVEKFSMDFYGNIALHWPFEVVIWDVKKRKKKKEVCLYFQWCVSYNLKFLTDPSLFLFSIRFVGICNFQHALFQNYLKVCVLA